MIRGWCHFELRASCAKRNPMNSKSIRGAHALGPMAPNDFKDLLQELQFTNGNDKNVVAEIYAKVFAAKATSTEELIMGFGFDTGDLRFLSRALKEFTVLRHLNLRANRITDTGPIAEVLKTNTTLQHLD